MCDSGYYRLFGNCKMCDDVALVTVLAIVVPAVVVLGTTVFIFWAGTHMPCTFRPTHPIPCRKVLCCSDQRNSVFKCDPVMRHGTRLAGLTPPA